MKNFLFLLLISLALFSCQKQTNNTTQSQWFKGNTHTHTILCGHADSHPDTVALWYLVRDYNFLILSEHDQFIDPASVNLPSNRRKDFILIPGEELSDVNHVHSTAMNVNRHVHPHPHTHEADLANDPEFDSNVNLMQRQVDSTLNAGGKLILNHPNFGNGVPAKDIQQVKTLADV